MNKFAIGIDIGGSHISTALVSLDTGLVLSNTVQRCIISSYTDLQGFMKSLLKSMNASCAVKDDEDFSIDAIGFAFPGPFNYERGVCEMEGVEKMDHLFAADIRTCCHNLLFHRFGISYKSIQFINDAQAFLLGVVAQEKLDARTVIGITVGTGIGSAFFKNGHLLGKDENIPASGYLYNVPYGDGIVEDYISTRWFLKKYTARNVEEIAIEADKGDPRAIELFQIFATHLAKVIAPWIRKFKAEVLILGGGIFHAWHLINKPFLSELQDQNIQINILINNNTDIMNISGAVKNAREQCQIPAICRKTEQYLLPATMPEKKAGEYDIYPACSLAEGSIYQTLEKLAMLLPDNGNIVIDGYGGIFWDQFIADLAIAFADRQVQPFWYNIDTALKPVASINELIAPYLNNDGPASIFGKRYTGNLQDFFDQEKLKKIKPSEKGLNIIYGTGAALSGWNGVHIYIDIPKNEIQFRSRARAITNLGDDTKPDANAQYKRFYFIDWPVLNAHKQALLPKIDFIIDGQQTSLYPFTTGNSFRNTLSYLSHHSFRARPWFEPGVWGGDWIKNRITSLAPEVPNYAWSFELITPENGLLIEDKGRLMEVSFDWLMFAHASEVLGKAYNKFGTYFPIRFNYLDTFGGDNLSVQCHPSLSYAQQKFGELITQDETYYIMDQKEGSGVYIGFTNETDAISFEAALRQSQQTKQPMNVTEHVQFIPSKKHDLFLIPNKTVHSSGINNLVLEISSTPYIFTFKLYDWVRPDLNGNLRPINIDHGMQNLDFSRKGEVVQKDLISYPVIVQQGVNYTHWHLPTHPDHFYDIERYEWEGTIEISTREQCHILSLVEGSQYCVIINEQQKIYNYTETVIIPAAAGKYFITYLGKGKGKLIKAFVKDNFCN